MARYSYRLYSEGNWTSTPGNALFVIVNQPDSGKKIIINRVAISSNHNVGTPRFVTNATNYTTELIPNIPASYYAIRTSLLSGGVDVTPKNSMD